MSQSTGETTRLNAEIDSTLYGKLLAKLALKKPRMTVRDWVTQQAKKEVGGK